MELSWWPGQGLPATSTFRGAGENTEEVGWGDPDDLGKETPTEEGVKAGII